jgi:hypothetical protein
MPLAAIRPHSLGTLAAALVGTLLLTNAMAVAGKAASKAHAAVAPKLSLDGNPSALSPSQLGDDSGLDKTVPDTPDMKIPDRIKFGNGTLRFDTSRKAVDTIPRVGLDAKDPAVLPAPKDQDLPTSYFGLTLTAPTH